MATFPLPSTRLYPASLGGVEYKTIAKQRMSPTRDCRDTVEALLMAEIRKPTGSLSDALKAFTSINGNRPTTVPIGVQPRHRGTYSREKSVSNARRGRLTGPVEVVRNLLRIGVLLWKWIRGWASIVRQVVDKSLESSQEPVLSSNQPVELCYTHQSQASSQLSTGVQQL